MKLNADDTERGTYRTESKPKLQKEAERPGPPNKLVSQGENGDSALHLGTGEKPKTNKEILPDRLQVQTSKYFTLSLWKWVLERK